MTTIVGFMVMSTLLVGEGSTIASPDDHAVLGFRPVTSRTYLAVRVSALLVRTIIIATLVSLAPVGVFLLKGGLHPGRAIVALGASYLAGLTVTLVLVAMYGWVLRLAGPQRLMRWSSYAQFAAQTVTFVGFMVATQELGKGALKGVALTGTLWSLLYPGAWMASWVAIATGNLAWMTLVAAFLSLALVAVLGRSIGGKLSLGYSETLSRVATAAAARQIVARTDSRWMHWMSAETRAIAILVRSHFRHDMKFRLGIISLIPVTLMYMYMGGWPRDPFVQRSLMDEIVQDPNSRRSSSEFMIILALLFVPLTLRRVLTMSAMYRASWIFHTTPSNSAELVMSSRNVITIFFLVPYLLIVGTAFGFAFDNPAHAVLHTFFIGLLSLLGLQFTILMSPALPFSQPAQKDTEGGMMIVTVLLSLILGVAAYFLLIKVVYRSNTLMLAAAAIALMLAFLMDRWTRRRARRLLAKQGYVE